jgi:hypothetical protein
MDKLKFTPFRTYLLLAAYPAHRFNERSRVGCQNCQDRANVLKHFPIRTKDLFLRSTLLTQELAKFRGTVSEVGRANLSRWNRSLITQSITATAHQPLCHFLDTNLSAETPRRGKHFLGRLLVPAYSSTGCALSS